ncbi:hypothetical protein E5676_scaffold118G00520 [Cucumis melo var. makuwa]|uniref:Uncharacterized protein n=1 Tax=Cucumis melo var. makuwa TaxID=1194695 RepID=A0A5D3C9Q0_CUCMM|nr:hypothetical protein E5676_scaffold118G00520 [Cucumis melo var. makuwa]
MKFQNSKKAMSFPTLFASIPPIQLSPSKRTPEPTPAIVTCPSSLAHRHLPIIACPSSFALRRLPFVACPSSVVVQCISSLLFGPFNQLRAFYLGEFHV